jgi:DNA-binding LytR/AlgR family response regulator
LRFCTGAGRDIHTCIANELFLSRRHHTGFEEVPVRTQAENQAAVLTPEPLMPFHQQSATIAIKHKGAILFIDPRDVFTVVARGNYVLLERESDSYLLHESISAMAEKLEPFGFLRVHRSALVNKSWVEQIRPDATGTYRLRLRSGKELTVTRKYKRNLKALAELWLGQDTFSSD